MEFDNSISFLKEKFREYYSKEKIELPERFGKREFAFMPFGAKLMKRHLSFKKREDFLKFILDMVPAHAYYSSAFYQNPGAPTMEEKGWMGAELIFDLDLDHLEKKKVKSYEEGLEAVKEEFSRLVNEFLMDDFGFERKYIKLYFSGGRGYHCHVLDPKVLSLDSSQRREIVDYIIGNDLDEDSIFVKRIVETSSVRSRGVTRLEIPKPSEPGWRGRVGRGIMELVKKIDDEDFVESLINLGIKRKDIERLRRELTRDRIRRIERGLIDQSKFIRRFFLKAAVRKIAISSVSGETDEPVTCDIKRLIRLPSSLHGKTGLKVCQIDIDKLEDFDPLYDAVVFSDDIVKVKLREKFRIKMKGEEFNLDRGLSKVPEYLAVFLVGRGIAKIIN
ncbi:MAG TPA: DNA primase catalytic subunit PriS [Thermoplasmatales archaeon]|nr:DNA primase catalytic subunit PriS [Thermoplasmatales archaeon]